jgi:hypothetical protein
MNAIQTEAATRWGTVKQASQRYPAFSEASFRYLIFNEKQNGFSACLRRVGRKVLIDFNAFEKWVDGGVK